MVVREEFTIKKKTYIKNYSDQGFYIERGGVLYEEAIDLIKFKDKRIYEETDIPIPTEEPEIIED